MRAYLYVPGFQSNMHFILIIRKKKKNNKKTLVVAHCPMPLAVFAHIHLNKNKICKMCSRRKNLGKRKRKKHVETKPTCIATERKKKMICS